VSTFPRSLPNAPAIKDEYQTDCYAYNAMGSQVLTIRNADKVDHDDAHTPKSCPPDLKAQTGWRTENQNTYDTFERLVASRQREHDDDHGTDEGRLGKNEAYCYDALDRRDRRLTDIDPADDPGETDTPQTALQKARAACSRDTTGTQIKAYDLSYLGLTEQLARENRPAGVQTYEYTADGRRLGRLKRPSSGTPQWRAYDTDAQGSVVGLEAPDSGKVGTDDHYDTNPYGDPTGTGDKTLSDDAKENPFQYQGFYKDQETGNYDMQARTYRPSIGQFLQQDRFADPAADLTLAEDPMTSNRYSFTAANPSTRGEYDGHILGTIAHGVKTAVTSILGAAANEQSGNTGSQALQRSLNQANAALDQLNSTLNILKVVSAASANQGSTAGAKPKTATEACGAQKTGTEGFTRCLMDFNNPGSSKQLDAQGGQYGDHSVGQLAGELARRAGPLVAEVGLFAATDGLSGFLGKALSPYVETLVSSFASRFGSAAVRGAATGADSAIEGSTRLVPGGGLAAHEAAGGHALLRHVGLDDAALFSRLASSPKITAASSFSSRETAEIAVGDVLRANEAKIAAKLAEGGKGNFAVNGRATDTIGRTVLRDEGIARDVSGVRVIVRPADSPLGYRVVTAFPTP
jgi:RHS repeat-associated protein